MLANSSLETLKICVELTTQPLIQIPYVLRLEIYRKVDIDRCPGLPMQRAGEGAAQHVGDSKIFEDLGYPKSNCDGIRVRQERSGSPSDGKPTGGTAELSQISATR